MAHVGAGQRDDGGRHGGREQHRLAGLGRLAQQPLDVRQEAEVQHLVGLVEHQRVHVRDVEGAAVHQVDEPAGGADDDVDAGGERVELGVVPHAAVDREDAEAAVLAGQVQVAGDLERELAGRRHDERLGLALGDVDVVGVLGGDAALEHRDAEGQRLAGARAGLADEVGAHQGDRQGHLLDREGRADAGAFERLADLGVDPELSEGNHGIVAFVSPRHVRRTPTNAISRGSAAHILSGAARGGQCHFARTGAQRSGPDPWRECIGRVRA